MITSIRKCSISLCKNTITGSSSEVCANNINSNGITYLCQIKIHITVRNCIIRFLMSIDNNCRISMQRHFVTVSHSYRINKCEWFFKRYYIFYRTSNRFPIIAQSSLTIKFRRIFIQCVRHTQTYRCQITNHPLVRFDHIIFRCCKLSGMNIT